MDSVVEIAGNGLDASQPLEVTTAADPSPAPEPVVAEQPQASTSTPASLPHKPIHSLVVDTGPLIKNEPPISTLIAQAEELWTIPSVISEIKDEATRTRVDTTLRPFLKLRSPRPESVKFISDFARRTGDLEVLSKPDIHLLALTYELEIERNGGDWRLRKTPTQKSVNGKPPGRANEDEIESTKTEEQTREQVENNEDISASVTSTDSALADQATPQEPDSDAAEAELRDLKLEEGPAGQDAPDEDPIAAEEQEDREGTAEDDDASDGWITPSNLKKHMAKDKVAAMPTQSTQRVLQAALITTDFAMQNVALRINLNLCSPTNLARISKVKSWVLRCHGCFQVTRQLNRQFCPRCGQATLTRTSCSTDAQGNFQIHLKKNFQWNKRGNVYSIPKPTHGSASGKLANVQGGGKGGWGRDLILAEDQKEYTRKVDEERKTRYKDLMDADYLPNILTGERSSGNGRIKVGAGRSINGKKRR